MNRIIKAAIIGAIVGSIIYFYGGGKTNTKKNGGNKIATIYDVDWTLIPTEGKHLLCSIIRTNGVKLKYTAVIDGNMSNKFVFPGTNIPPHLYYGASNLWVTLNEGQEHRFGFLSYKLE